MKWRWPWVSRVEHEKALADIGYWRQQAELEQVTRRAMERHIATLEALDKHHERDMIASEARYAELMASYRMLRLQGHSEPVPVPTIPEQKPDPVVAAINARAPDARTRALMLRKVAEERAKGTDDETIILGINRGHRPAEEVQ